MRKFSKDEIKKAADFKKKFLEYEREVFGRNIPDAGIEEEPLVNEEETSDTSNQEATDARANTQDPY